IAPLVGPSWRPGRRYRRKRLGQPLKFPASLVTIASSGRRSRNQVITRPRSSAPANPAGTSPASYSDRTVRRQPDQRGAGTGANPAAVAANSLIPDWIASFG